MATSVVRLQAHILLERRLDALPPNVSNWSEWSQNMTFTSVNTTESNNQTY